MFLHMHPYINFSSKNLYLLFFMISFRFPLYMDVRVMLSVVLLSQSVMWPRTTRDSDKPVQTQSQGDSHVHDSQKGVRSNFPFHHRQH